MSSDTVEAKIVEGDKDEALAVRDNATMVAMERAVIDQQIATAKAYPRSVEQFKQDCLSMATLDQETAESMFYQLPRDGKLIEGPSVRLAEIAGTCWGNVRYTAEVVEVGDEFLTAQGRCHDLQRNVDIALRVRRRIVNKWGKRLNADMIGTTGQAACSVALRNAIFKVIPMAFIKPVLVEAKRVAAGDEKTLAGRLDAALLWFKNRSVKPEWVFALLSTDEHPVKGKGDVTLQHIAQMNGIRNAIKEGEASVADFFDPFMVPEGETKKGPVSVESLKGSGVKKEKPSDAKKESEKAEAKAEAKAAPKVSQEPVEVPEPSADAVKKAEDLF